MSWFLTRFFEGMFGPFLQWFQVCRLFLVVSVRWGEAGGISCSSERHPREFTACVHEPFAFLTELERALGSTSASITVPIAKPGSSIAPDTDFFAGKGLGAGCAVCVHKRANQHDSRTPSAGVEALKCVLLSQPLQGTYFM